MYNFLWFYSGVYILQMFWKNPPPIFSLKTFPSDKRGGFHTKCHFFSKLETSTRKIIIKIISTWAFIQDFHPSQCLILQHQGGEGVRGIAPWSWSIFWVSRCQMSNFKTFILAYPFSSPSLLTFFLPLPRSPLFSTIPTHIFFPFPSYPFASLLNTVFPFPSYLFASPLTSFPLPCLHFLPLPC